MGRKNHKIKEAKRKAKIKKGGIKTTISWGKIRLVIILLWFLGIQAAGIFSPKSKFEKAKERVAENPGDLEAHLVLSEELLQNNRLAEAEKELLVASKFQQIDSLSANQLDSNNIQNVLGLETSRLDALILQKQESDPRDLEVLIQKWQEILKEKPDYRDGWLKLALYLIKVERTNEAQEALERAKDLDPNYEVVGELEKLLLQGNQGN